jgi:hypothetical protein
VVAAAVQKALHYVCVQYQVLTLVQDVVLVVVGVVLVPPVVPPWLLAVQGSHLYFCS